MADVAVLDVRLHGQSVGALTRLPDDKNIFALDERYIADDARPTLSLSLKDEYGGLRTTFQPTQTRVAPFFANLLPEGKMREYLAARAQVNERREFFLLWVLGRDLPGAIEIHPADGQSWPDDATGRADGDTSKGAQALHFSLAGVQLKFSAIKNARGGLTIPVDGTGGSWILKLPSTSHDGVPENEFAMMEMARRVGIDVPDTKLMKISDIGGLPDGVDVAGSDAFAIRRFDRAESGRKIHIEDFAQVFGVYPEKKYEKAGHESIARVVWPEVGETGIAELTRRIAFNALIGNGDMHLKNWSLIYPDGRNAALAPAYDFVSTLSYIAGDRFALNLAGSKRFADITDTQFKRFAAKARLPGRLVLDTLDATVRSFADVWHSAGDLPLSKPVKHAMDAHLKNLPIWTSRFG